MENKRIFICGPSGTGKTTLGEWISQTYRIPFITTSSKPLWEKHGIKSHLELLNKGALEPSFALDFQNELLDFREDALKNYDNFVTDRSPIDNLVYYLMQVSHQATEQATYDYKARCASLMAMGNKIIYTPFNADITLENDRMRIDSYHYQHYTSGVFDYVLERNLLDLHLLYNNDDIMNLSDWDWNTRMARVQWLLQEPNKLKQFMKKRWLKRKNS